MKHPLTFRSSEDKMTVGECWEVLRALADGRVKDNNLQPDDYPLDIRPSQIVTIKAIIKEIELCHNLMHNQNMDEKLSSTTKSL